jgi:hypothetical protein
MMEIQNWLCASKEETVCKMWKDNINGDLREGVDWIELHEDGVQLWFLFANIVMNLCAP